MLTTGVSCALGAAVYYFCFGFIFIFGGVFFGFIFIFGGFFLVFVFCKCSFIYT
jgi:hypothetical protein